MRNDVELMLGMRLGATLRNVPAHHGVALRALGDKERDAVRGVMNPGRAARQAAQAQHADSWVPPVIRAAIVAIVRSRSCSRLIAR